MESQDHLDYYKNQQITQNNRKKYKDAISDLPYNNIQKSQDRTGSMNRGQEKNKNGLAVLTAQQKHGVNLKERSSSALAMNVGSF